MAVHRAPFCIVEMAVLRPASLTVPSHEIRKCLALTLLLSWHHISIDQIVQTITDVYILMCEDNEVLSAHLAGQVLLLIH